jgi:flagellar biosynthesis/type III secretory pathway protein FliH
VKDEAQAKDLSGRYDIMEVDFISLSKTDLNSEVPIVRFLSNLFSSDASTLEERKRVLEEEFNISMTLEICEEMESVCTLTESVLQEGVEIGREQGLEEGREQGIEIGTVTTLANNVISLMRNFGCDADTAMDYLGVEGPIREVVAEKVMSAMVAY